MIFFVFIKPKKAFNQNRPSFVYVPEAYNYWGIVFSDSGVSSFFDCETYSIEEKNIELRIPINTTAKMFSNFKTFSDKIIFDSYAVRTYIEGVFNPESGKNKGRKIYFDSHYFNLPCQYLFRIENGDNGNPQLHLIVEGTNYESIFEKVDLFPWEQAHKNLIDWRRILIGNWLRQEPTQLVGNEPFDDTKGFAATSFKEDGASTRFVKTQDGQYVKSEYKYEIVVPGIDRCAVEFNGTNKKRYYVTFDKNDINKMYLQGETAQLTYKKAGKIPWDN